jgi:hypothetical protein
LLGTFLCGLLNLIFVCCNWQEAKKPFLCYIGGTALLVLSIISMPNLTKGPLSPNAPPPAVNAR